MWWLACSSPVNWLFAALALGLIVYGVALTAAIISGAWLVESEPEYTQLATMLNVAGTI